MKRYHMHTKSCSCSNCVYRSRSEQPSVQQIIDTGSRIDRLYYGKYIPLRERKLLQKLIRTRAVYDDVRTQLLSASEEDVKSHGQEDDSTERSSAVVNLVDLVDRGQIGPKNASKLSNCCTCCSCSSFKKLKMADHPPVHRNSVPYDAIARYTMEAKRKGRAHRKKLSTQISSTIRTVKFKAKRIRSEPCICTFKFNVSQRPSNDVTRKVKEKTLTSITTKDSKRTVKKESKALKFKRCLCTPMSVKRKKRKTLSTESQGISNKKRFRIKKDSLTLFREKLKKKRMIKKWACKYGVCMPDECVPEECYEKMRSRAVKKYHNRMSGTQLMATNADSAVPLKRKTFYVKKKQIVRKTDSKTQTQIKKHVIKKELSDQMTELTPSFKLAMHHQKKNNPKLTSQEIINIVRNNRHQPFHIKESSSQTSKLAHKEERPFYCECYPDTLLPKTKMRSKSVRSGDDHLRRKIKKKSSLAITKSQSEYVQSNIVDNVELSDNRKRIQYKENEQQRKRKSSVKDITLTETDSHSSRDAVKIGSSFSFNIEFYKEKLQNPGFKEEVIGKQKYVEDIYSTLKTKGRSQRTRKKRKRHISSQSVSLKSNATHTEHLLKRCICALKIPKKRKDNLNTPVSKKTMTMTTYTSNIVYVTPPLTNTSPTRLPYECEPFFCTPGACDPFECSKRIKARNRLKRIPKEVNTSRASKRSTHTLALQPKPKTSRKIQFTSREHEKEYSKSKEKPKEVFDISQTQAVRIGSTFSFNIEFSKDKICDYDSYKNQKYIHVGPHTNKVHYKGIKIHKPRLRHTTSQTSKTEKSKQTRIKPSLERCFCTLNLLKEQGTLTPLQNKDSSTIMRHEYVATDKEYVKYYRKQATLLPYEFEPTDECECKKSLKMQNNDYRNRYSDTGNPKTKSVYTKSETSARKSQLSSKAMFKRKRVQQQNNATPTTRQVVRIGSSFSFNIDFHKDKKRNNDRYDNVKRVRKPDELVQKIHHTKAASGPENQHNYKRMSVTSAIKRCFCTLKLAEGGKTKKRHNKNNNAQNLPDYEPINADHISKNIQKREVKREVFCQCKNRKQSINVDTDVIPTYPKKKIHNAPKIIPSHKQNVRQAVRIGSQFDFNIDFHRQKIYDIKSANDEMFRSRKKEMKLRNKRNVEKKSKLIKKEKVKLQIVEQEKVKNESKTCKKMFEGWFKKLKIKRSKSQYTMVKIRKPKPGAEEAPLNMPVTAAFFKVIHDRDLIRINSNGRKVMEKSDKMYYKNRRLVQKKYTEEQQRIDNAKSPLRCLKRKYMKLNKSSSKNINISEASNYTKCRYIPCEDISYGHNPFAQYLYSLNVRVSSQGTKQWQSVKSSNLQKYECDPPNECDALECSKPINGRYKRSISSETESHDTRSVKTVTISKPMTKSKTVETYKSLNNEFNSQTNLKKCMPYKCNEVKVKEFDSCESTRQAINLGSNISFNIELYKQEKTANDICEPRSINLKDERQSISLPMSNKDKGVSNATSLSMGSAKNRNKTDVKDRGIGHMIKRCFCTLKLRNKAKEENITFSKRNTADLPFGDIMLNKNRMVNTHKLKLYEYALGVCKPGECDPHECYELKQKRLKKCGKCVGTDCNRKCNSNVTDFDSKIAKKKIVQSTLKRHIQESTPTHHLFPKNKQALRFGSTISFSVEFFRDHPTEPSVEKECPNIPQTAPCREISRKRLPQIAQGGTKSRYSQSAQEVVKQKTHDTGFSAASIMEKCFCTQKHGERRKRDIAKSMKRTVKVSKINSNRDVKHNMLKSVSKADCPKKHDTCLSAAGILKRYFCTRQLAKKGKRKIDKNQKETVNSNRDVKNNILKCASKANNLKTHGTALSAASIDKRCLCTQKLVKIEKRKIEKSKQKTVKVSKRNPNKVVKSDKLHRAIGAKIQKTHNTGLSAASIVKRCFCTESGKRKIDKSKKEAVEISKSNPKRDLKHYILQSATGAKRPKMHNTVSSGVNIVKWCFCTQKVIKKGKGKIDKSKKEAVKVSQTKPKRDLKHDKIKKEVVKVSKTNPNAGSSAASIVKRCFCTLKLVKKEKHKIDKSLKEIVNAPKINPKRDVLHIVSGAERPKTHDTGLGARSIKERCFCTLKLIKKGKYKKDTIKKNTNKNLIVPNSNPNRHAKNNIMLHKSTATKGGRLSMYTNCTSDNCNRIESLKNIKFEPLALKSQAQKNKPAKKVKKTPTNILKRCICLLKLSPAVTNKKLSEESLQEFSTETHKPTTKIEGNLLVLKESDMETIMPYSKKKFKKHTSCAKLKQPTSINNNITQQINTNKCVISDKIVCPTCKRNETIKKQDTQNDICKILVDEINKIKEKVKTQVCEDLAPTGKMSENNESSKAKKITQDRISSRKSVRPKANVEITADQDDDLCKCETTAIHTKEGKLVTISNLNPTKEQLNLAKNMKKDQTIIQGLYPCTCSDDKTDIHSTVKTCPVCKTFKKEQFTIKWFTKRLNGALVTNTLNKLKSKARKTLCQILSGDEKPQVKKEIVPLFEMVVNKDDMSVMNQEEIMTRIRNYKDYKAEEEPKFDMIIERSNARILNKAEIQKNFIIKSKSLKDEMITKSPVKAPKKAKRQAYSLEIHGKGCKCCYCAKKGWKTKFSITRKRLQSPDGMPSYSKPKPCICGSNVCKKAIDAEEKKRLLIQEKNRLKHKPCTCGSNVCKAEAEKSIPSDQTEKLDEKLKKEKGNKDKKMKGKTKNGKDKKKSKDKGKQRSKEEMEKMKIKAQKEKEKAKQTGKKKKKGKDKKTYLKSKLDPEFKKKMKMDRIKDARSDKSRSKRAKVYKIEDAQRRKMRKKEDKRTLKRMKKYKNSDILLCADSVLDFGKLIVNTSSTILRSAYRVARDPKLAKQYIEQLVKTKKIKDTVSSSGVVTTASRIAKRVSYMHSTKAVMKKLETYPVTNYMMHFADKDPKKRLRKAGPVKRVREPFDFQCSLYMASLRKRPHWAVYFASPWFYPHWISFLRILRQVKELIILLLAVVVWSPCVFCLEGFRALLCCCLCTE